MKSLCSSKITKQHPVTVFFINTPADGYSPAASNYFSWISIDKTNEAGYSAYERDNRPQI